jgi:16S rRNA A1518/A1519 N6-dimethyltransferase RsmA/KsgA/DIM1 with predicted DNA glycosylase/AP lyase activity
VAELLEKAGVSADDRAEALTLEQWQQLTQIYNK